MARTGVRDPGNTQITPDTRSEPRSTGSHAHLPAMAQDVPVMATPSCADFSLKLGRIPIESNGTPRSMHVARVTLTATTSTTTKTFVFYARRIVLPCHPSIDRVVFREHRPGSTSVISVGDGNEKLQIGPAHEPHEATLAVNFLGHARMHASTSAMDPGCEVGGASATFYVAHSLRARDRTWPCAFRCTTGPHQRQSTSPRGSKTRARSACK